VLEKAQMFRDWSARAFLREDYSQAIVPDDKRAGFRFVAEGLRRIDREFDRGLDLGCGPTLHRAAQLVRWVRRLDLADADEPSLEELRLWLGQDPAAHDWSTYLGAPGGVLAWEPDAGTVAARETMLRQRLGEILSCDIRLPMPLGEPRQYPLVSCCFCLEWVTPTLEGWRANLARTAELVTAGGWLVMLGCHACDGRLVEGRRYPCAHINQADVRTQLAVLDFDPASIDLELTPGTTPEIDDVRELFMVFAQKR
jgi:hypothetical protein